MTSTTDDHLPGASVWQQEIFDALVAHERDEEKVISSYESFVDRTDSDTVRYLITLVVEDERRHHVMLNQLANTVRAQATLEERGPRIPYLDVHKQDAELLAATHKFLEFERHDAAELKVLSRRVGTHAGSVAGFVVDLLRSDTERHIRILKFIEDLVRHSPLP